MTTPRPFAPLSSAPPTAGKAGAGRPISDAGRPPDFEAAGILPVHPSGAVLLHLRDDRPDVGSPNRWGMLGGMIEPGESRKAAAFRELQEEAGRRPAALVLFAVDDHPSLRRPGTTVRSHIFAAAVDWSLDDL